MLKTHSHHQQQIRVGWQWVVPAAERLEPSSRSPGVVVTGVRLGLATSLPPCVRHIVKSLISTICSVRWEQCRGCGRRAGTRGTRSGCPSGGRVGRWSYRPTDLATPCPGCS
ncbi:hypothetical protein C8034_v003442 [Colletotrichum sidae]|uniref:Uncharacterized protein n=1 Tax=Colletotrichum sidae TaxID=1347389 RepID=A0A4R8TAG2_9PEZI|nr:hypothetical protein C8034_v003442 [Colletotrichum sidae]